MLISVDMTPNVLEYVQTHSRGEDELLRELREETSKLAEKNMQIPPDQGFLTTLLVRMVNAERVIEVGVFTGYSTLCTARALRPGGRVIACDTSPEWTGIARRYWKRAGVDDRIDLRLAPAQETLSQLVEEGHESTFDYIFLDADKESIDLYYEFSLQLVRPGGLIVIDNVLWSGDVADENVNDTETRALRELNAKVRDDDRVDSVLMPIADGLMLALKR